MSARVDRSLRARVVNRANGSCEYCLVHADYSTFPHEVDHIIAVKHDGKSVFENLAYACAQCNRYKGSDFATLDPDSGVVILLFNPRLQRWGEHFALDGPQIVPLSETGGATVRLLQLNQIDRLLLRKELLAGGRYPFQFGRA